MMCIGSNEEVLGLPEEERGISTPIEHSFDIDVSKVKEGTNFTPTEPKKKKKEVIIEKAKSKRNEQCGKSSNLF